VPSLLQPCGLESGSLDARGISAGTAKMNMCQAGRKGWLRLSSPALALYHRPPNLRETLGRRSMSERSVVFLAIIVVAAIALLGYFQFRREGGTQATSPSSGPQGVGGFLRFFIIATRFIGPLWGAIQANAEFSSIGRSDPLRYQSSEMGAFLVSFWIYFAVITAYGWWYTSKLLNEFRPESVHLTIWGLAITAISAPVFTFIGGAIILGAGASEPVLVQTLASAVQGAIVAGIWIAYFRVSRRVANTYFPTGSARAPEPTASPSHSSPVERMSAIAGTEPRVRDAGRPVISASGPVTSQPPTPDPNRFFALALAEFDGPNRNIGLWARCFAEAAGNENAAKAQYLTIAAKALKEADDKRQLETEMKLLDDVAEKIVREDELARRGLKSEAMVGPRADHQLQEHLDGTFTVRHPSGLMKRFNDEGSARAWAGEKA
jgi:hypothetical protein